MSLSDTFRYYWVDMADPRTNDWPLIGSIYSVPLLIFAYLYFVLKCGPRFMETRKPYSLKTFMKFYNLFQVVVNAVIIYYFIDAGWFTEFGIKCEPIIYTYERGPYQLTKVMWWVLLLKITDFVETGVFVLRKKNQQITFLHLYHHVTTVVLVWLGTKYIAGGMSTFLVMLNSGVHVIMYTYYFLSNSGPAVRRVVSKFKHVITTIQMVQFVIMLLYLMQTLQPSCNVPMLPVPIFLVNLLINLYLFYDFYRTSYNRQTPKRA